MKNNKTFDTLSWWLIGFAIVLALFAIFSPLIFTSEGCIVFDSDTGAIGDTIGGIMNPFIGMVSIIVMFLAFYMQFKANKEMHLQFEINQFNNQFFEMLKTHKENSHFITNQIFLTEQLGNKKIEHKGFDWFIKELEKEYDKRKK